jgi:hypothetical protein
MRRLGQIVFVSLTFLLFFLSFETVRASQFEPTYPSEGILSRDMNYAMDPQIDYARFSGRVTDKDQSEKIFKIHVENNNTRFFRSGDAVFFTVSAHKKVEECRGFVRTVEDFYFAMYVENLSNCWQGGYFKRGTLLHFRSPALAARIYESMKYRESLFGRKEDYLTQLQSVNNFLWTFDQQKIKLAAEFDQKIVQLQKVKQQALDQLVLERQQQVQIQAKLMSELNKLDRDLKFYRIDRQEFIEDRWQSDQDLGLPVGQRPQELKEPTVRKYQ